MNKKNVLIGVGIAVLVALCIGIAIFAGTGGTDYYTQMGDVICGRRKHYHTAACKKYALYTGEKAGTESGGGVCRIGIGSQLYQRRNL